MLSKTEHVSSLLQGYILPQLRYLIDITRSNKLEVTKPSWQHNQKSTTVSSSMIRINASECIGLFWIFVKT